MVDVIERETVGEAIEATVNYILDNGDKIFTQTASPGSTDVRSGGALDPHRVTIRNARLHAQPFALDREGFRFVRHDTKVADFFDDDEIRRVYYPEMEALVKAESGASRVVVFDHTLRTADADEREARKIREVVRRVHNDYTEWSGPQRVRDLLPDEAEKLLQRRFAIVQVWRPIRHPVESSPLAMCDARSIALDPQLICYSWISGITDVAQIVFVRKRLVEIQYLQTSFTLEQRQECLHPVHHPHHIDVDHPAPILQRNVVGP